MHLTEGYIVQAREGGRVSTLSHAFEWHARNEPLREDLLSAESVIALRDHVVVPDSADEGIEYFEFHVDEFKARSSHTLQQGKWTAGSKGVELTGEPVEFFAGAEELVIKV